MEEEKEEEEENGRGGGEVEEEEEEESEHGRRIFGQKEGTKIKERERESTCPTAALQMVCIVARLCNDGRCLVFL